MLANIQLPNGTMDIEYDERVYDPNFSHYRDTVGLADLCIKEVNPSRLCDVACGSGVIGLALKKLNPFLDVYLSDKDPIAVAQTKKNAKKLGLKVTVLQTDLLPSTRFFPVVTANLPTYDDEQLVENVLNGPEIAYKAGKDGLSLYRKLIKQIQPGGFLICEVQERHQEAFLELVSDFTLVARSESAFALFRPQRPVNQLS